MQFKIPTRWEQWAKTLLSAFITGFANAFLAAVGITGAEMAGIHVQQLNLRQAVGVALSGGIVGAMAYLTKSPVPPDSTGQTEIINKSDLVSKP